MLMAPKGIGIRLIDFTLDDPFHVNRWMCSKCGLVLDFKFELGYGEPGWSEIEPYEWIDEDGDYQEGAAEFCPRCGLSFQKFPPTFVTVREVNKLSDFFQEGEGEGQTLEFKVKFAANRIRNTIAAFATTQGGMIILGITKEGAPVGYEGEEKIDTTEGKDKLQQRIRGLLDQIVPRVQVRVYFVGNEAGLHFAIIAVPKGPEPFYSIDGKVYVRELEQTRGAKPNEIRAFLDRWREWHQRS